MVEQWVKDIAESEGFGGALEAGKQFTHPKQGLVQIIDGAYWRPGGFSNFWSWKKVKDGKPYGKTYNGYGWM